MLTCRAVSAGYPGRPVLHGVDLTVEPGQLWALLGPNGAGKSTLAKVCLGLVPSSAGEVKVGGMNAMTTSRSLLAKAAAWVPQESAGGQALQFTGLELALMGVEPRLAAFGLPSKSDADEARKLLEWLTVGALADRRLNEASGGERRLVWLARALLQKPKLLVLDEPTAFLDVKHQLIVMAELKKRVGEGLAVLAVLHDVNQAVTYATHAALLRDGRVMAAGPVGEVLQPAKLEELYGARFVEVLEPRRFFLTEAR
jgi:iron complex transport system ATP-binding protein